MRGKGTQCERQRAIKDFPPWPGLRQRTNAPHILTLSPFKGEDKQRNGLIAEKA